MRFAVQERSKPPVCGVPDDWFSSIVVFEQVPVGLTVISEADWVGGASGVGWVAGTPVVMTVTGAVVGITVGSVVGTAGGSTVASVIVATVVGSGVPVEVTAGKISGVGSSGVATLTCCTPEAPIVPRFPPGSKSLAA